eukprot:jgi/Mesvir1/8779/Mv02690-RA.2
MAFSHARNSLRLVRCMSSSTRSGIVGVVGAGQMGCGIAQVAATAGYPVILCDSSDSQLASSIPRIRQSLARLTRKSVISEADASAALSRITTTARLDDLSNVHLALEAVPEVEPLKLRIFQQLDRIVADPAAILATNTSSISVTRIGAATSRPERVIGLHFMNPPPLMQLVEVIPGLATSEEVVRAASALVESMGKKVTLARDMPGFIVNRVLMPMVGGDIMNRNPVTVLSSCCVVIAEVCEDNQPRAHAHGRWVGNHEDSSTCPPVSPMARAHGE